MHLLTFLIETFTFQLNPLVFTLCNTNHTKPAQSTTATAMATMPIMKLGTIMSNDNAHYSNCLPEKCVIWASEYNLGPQIWGPSGSATALN